jgi:glycosyltransferase involved in cell wall biosynthesis
MERDAYRVAAPKYCVAGWLVEIGRRFGVPEEQLLHVPLGLDHEVFSARTPFDQREIDVVTVFNGHHQKGWKVGLEALHEISRHTPDVNGVVFGMSPLDEGLPRGFRFIEAPDHRTLADEIFNHAKVFVQPSYHEGFGYPAVEAMACGATLVTTDNGGSRDYGIEGRTARVVLPGDATGLAEKTVELLHDEPTRIRLATAGTELVRESFDWDRSSALLGAHLERYVADPEQFRQPPGPYEEWTGHGLGLEVM